MIEKMNETDYETVKAMAHKLQLQHVKGREDIFDPAYEEYNIDSFRELVNSDNKLAYTAKENGRILGYIVAEIINLKGVFKKTVIVYVNDLYVSEKARGQHIGSSLMARIEEDVRRIKAQRIELMVWNFNQEAIAFYERLGYGIRSMIMDKVL